MTPEESVCVERVQVEAARRKVLIGARLCFSFLARGEQAPQTY